MCAIFAKDVEQRCSEGREILTTPVAQDKLSTLPLDRVAVLNLLELGQTIIKELLLGQSGAYGRC